MQRPNLALRSRNYHRVATYITAVVIFLGINTCRNKSIFCSKIFRLTHNNVFASALGTNRATFSALLGSNHRIRKSTKAATATRYLSRTTTMSSSKSKTDDVEKAYNLSIHWFRNGLRFHDNLPLYDACTNSENMLPLYIIDPTSPFSQTKNRRAGIIRANFILESMKELNAKFIKSQEEKGGDEKSQLVVMIGKPEDVLPLLIQQIDANALYYEREPAHPVKESDAGVLDAIKKETKECTIHGYDTHTLFPMDVYLAKCKDNVAPSTYGVFTKTFQKLLPVSAEISDINEDMGVVPSISASVLTKMKEFVDKDESVHLIDLAKISAIDILEQHLGYSDVEEKLANRNKSGLSFQGGEDVGTNLLETMCSRTKWIWTFEKPKTKPTGLKVDTTGLSPYVKHGCVSPRKFYHELSDVYAKCPTPAKSLSKPPVSLHGQLMWREYNYLMGYSTPNFDKMENNPVARQIPWDDDPKLIEAWKNAQTGYPYIDAAITQLKQTGWMHHLARHSVACFLTRGDLWQSWEKGAEFFEEELIDADWSVNNYNWQWLSCTAHFYQYFRCYSPVSFPKKTDANGDYIRKWLPQFKDYPKGYIYEPWTAPLSVQRKAGVIIGEDYPEPIVEHKTISKSNMGRMKQAYEEHKAKAASASKTSAKPKPAKRARTKK